MLSHGECSVPVSVSLRNFGFHAASASGPWAKKNRAGGMPARICLREIEAGIWIFRSSADSLSLDSCRVFKNRMVPAE
jgi:hypothetical protein